MAASLTTTTPAAAAEAMKKDAEMLLARASIVEVAFWLLDGVCEHLAATLEVL